MAQRPSKRDRFLSALRPSSRSKRGSPVTRTPSPSPTPPVSDASRRNAPEPLPPSPKSSSGSHSAIEINAKLWQQAIQRAGSDNDWPKFLEEFLGGKEPDSIDFVIEQLEDARLQCEQRKWTISIGGKSIVLRDVVDSVVQYAAIFKDVGDTVVACDPTQHAALAWGLVQWLVTAAVKNQAAHTLLSDYKPVACIISQCTVYVELFAARTTVTQAVKTTLTDAVIGVYTATLRYLICAWKFQQQSKLGHVWTSVIKPERLQESMSEVQASNTVMLASKAQAQSQVITDQSIQTRTLLGMISRLGPAFDDIAQQIQSLQAQQEAERHRATSLAALDKLSSFVYHARYTQILQLRLNETCRWVLVEPQYIAWTEEKSSGMIQLSVGAGKSTIMATVVEDQLQTAKRSSQTIRIAYHFCDGTAQQSQSLGLILNSLLRQLCQYPTTDIPLELKARLDNDQEGALRANEAEPFLTQLMLRHNTVIMIDALDEVSKDVCANLVGILRRLCENKDSKTTYTKVFVSSRSWHRIERLLAGFKMITVQNHGDIDHYIDERLLMFVQGSYADLEDSKPRIRKALRGRADGMFRWLQMSFEVLSTNEDLLTEDAIIEAIAALPSELEALYEQLYREIQDSRGQTAGNVRRFLTLLMYSEVPLKTSEAIEATLRDTNARSPEGYLIDQSRSLVEWDRSQDTFRLAHATVRTFLEDKDDFSYFKGHALLACICLTCLQRDLPHGKPVEEWKLRSFPSYAFVYWPWHIFYAWTERFIDPELRRFFPHRPKTTLEKWACSVADAIDTHLQRRLSTLRTLGNDTSSSVSESDRVSSGPHVLGQSSDGSDGEHSTFDRITPALSLDIQSASESSPRSQRGYSGEHSSGVIPDSEANEEITMLEEYLSHLEDRPTYTTSDSDEEVRGVDTWKEFRSEIPNPIWALLYWKLTDVYLSTRTTVDPIFLELVRDPIWYTTVSSDGSEHEVQTFTSKGPPLGSFASEGDYHGIKALLPHVTERGMTECRPNPPMWEVLRNENLDQEQLIDVLGSLLQMGFSINEPHGGYASQTMLYHALEYANAPAPTVLYLLAEGARVDVRDDYGLSPLQHACKSCSRALIEIVRALLQYGASASATWRNGKTCLHALAWNDQLSDVLQLEAVPVLQEAGLDIDTVDDNGRTALHTALIRGNAPLARALLRQGASTEVADRFGWTPWHYLIVSPVEVSTSRGLAKYMMNELRRKLSCEHTGANLANRLQSALNRQDIIGTTAIALAALWNKSQLMRLLMKAGASLNSSVNGSTSVLALACISGHFSLAAELYAAGARDPRIDALAFSRTHHITETGAINSQPQARVVGPSKVEHPWPQLGKTVLPLEALHPNLSRKYTIDKKSGVVMMDEAVDLCEALLRSGALWEGEQEWEQDHEATEPAKDNSLWLRHMSQCDVWCRCYDGLESLQIEITASPLPEQSLPMDEKSSAFPPTVSTPCHAEQDFNAMAFDFKNALESVQSLTTVRWLDSEDEGKISEDSKARLLNFLETHELPTAELHTKWDEKAEETLEKWLKALGESEQQSHIGLADDSDSDADDEEDISRAKPPMKAILDRMIGIS